MGSIRLPIVKKMKLFSLVLASSAHAFFGIPQYTGIGVAEASGPQTNSHLTACDILPTEPKCADCAKVGAACLDDDNLAFCEKLGFNSMMNMCKTFGGPPSKLTAAPKKPKRPKAPKKAKKPKKAKPTCSTAEPVTCEGCMKMKGKCRKPFKDTCKALCTPKCENPPTNCAECDTLSGACAKDRKVKMTCKKLCKPPKKQQRVL